MNRCHIGPAEPGMLKLALRAFAQVGTFCEPYAFTAFLNCLRSVCLPTKRDAAAEGGTQHGDAADEQASAASPLALLEDVGALLRQHSLRGSPEMFKLLLDTLVDFTGSPVGSGKPEKGNKRGGGAAARNQGRDAAE